MIKYQNKFQSDPLGALTDQEEVEMFSLPCYLECSSKPVWSEEENEDFNGTHKQG